MAHWRALQVQPQREVAVERALAEYAIPAFCPRFHVRLHRPGSPIVARPLFPSYLFVNIEEHPIALVKRCRHVIDILGTIPIPMSVIEHLRNAPANVCVSTQWVEGHLYRLKQERPLAGLLARLERLDTHDRASVILRLFGAERVVSVHLSDLEEQ